MLSLYKTRSNCDFCRLFFERFCLTKPSELLHPLSKLCLFLLCFIFNLAPSIAIATDLSGHKLGEITQNMVWVDSDKWQVKLHKMQKSFWMDRFEVTQKEYFAVMGNNPSFFKGENHPVEKVTWYDAKMFCEKRGKRLPMEGEWEKAARAGSSSSFFWKNENPDAFAWHKGNAYKKTHPVGSKKPNALGLYDMAGNVWEWTSSNHESGGKVVRGGSWRNGVGSLKSSHRINSLPIHKFHYVGFRCAVLGTMD